MFHFTARWQLLTGVPTVQPGQDNLEVLMSCRHQITIRETPKKRRHSISLATYTPFMGISGKKEEVHMRMCIHQIFLKSTVSCCCYPKDTSTLKPIMLAAAWGKISAFAQ